MMVGGQSIALLMTNFEATGRAMAGHRLCFGNDSFCSMDDTRFQ